MNKYMLCAVLALIATQLYPAAQPTQPRVPEHIEWANRTMEEIRAREAAREAAIAAMTPEQQKEYHAKQKAALEAEDAPEFTYLVPHRP